MPLLPNLSITAMVLDLISFLGICMTTEFCSNKIVHLTFCYFFLIKLKIVLLVVLTILKCYIINYILLVIIFCLAGKMYLFQLSFSGRAEHDI